MRILILTNNPNRASFRQRIGAYCDILRRNAIRCEVAKLPSGFLARRRLFKRASDFDGVFLHKKKLNFFDGHWLRRYSKKIIYDFDDAVMYDPEAPDRDRSSHFRPFRRTAKLADIVIAGNSYLAEHAIRFNPNVEVLPTGLDTGAYRVDAGLRNDGKIRLVWIGSKSTLRYLAEIKPALEEIGSCLNNVVLRIICDEFFDLENMQVERRQWSEQTEAIELRTSDIGLAPLPDNRFTRGKCGFKVLQYTAAGLPVVASPVGVNSEYVRHGVTGFLVTNLSQWRERIAELIANPDLRKTMGEENLAQAENFDVPVIGKKLAQLITKCLHDVTS
jgi:glycosyltransferase involved in cell wall biosynthesis